MSAWVYSLSHPDFEENVFDIANTFSKADSMSNQMCLTILLATTNWTNMEQMQVRGLQVFKHDYNLINITVGFNTYQWQKLVTSMTHDLSSFLCCPIRSTTMFLNIIQYIKTHSILFQILSWCLGKSPLRICWCFEGKMWNSSIHSIWLSHPAFLECSLSSATKGESEEKNADILAKNNQHLGQDPGKTCPNRESTIVQ